MLIILANLDFNAFYLVCTFMSYRQMGKLNYRMVSFYFSVRLAADSGSFRGFLCQARTDISAYSSTVGVLSQSGLVSMKENCGTVCILTSIKNAIIYSFIRNAIKYLRHFCIILTSPISGIIRTLFLKRDFCIL